MSTTTEPQATDPQAREPPAPPPLTAEEATSWAAMAEIYGTWIEALDHGADGVAAVRHALLMRLSYMRSEIDRASTREGPQT